MDLPRIARKYAHIPVEATVAGGLPAVLPGVDVALTKLRKAPTKDTTWTPSSFTQGVATVLIAGPDADPDSALVVPEAGAELWVRVTDSPEVDAARIATITIV